MPIDKHIKVPYLELSTLEGQQPQNATCFIPTSSTNVSITYTKITTIETQSHLIGVTISKNLQEGSQSDLLNTRETLKQFLIL